MAPPVGPVPLQQQNRGCGLPCYHSLRGPQTSQDFGWGGPYSARRPGDRCGPVLDAVEYCAPARSLPCHHGSARPFLEEANGPLGARRDRRSEPGHQAACNLGRRRPVARLKQ